MILELRKGRLEEVDNELKITNEELDKNIKMFSIDDSERESL